MCHGKGQCLLNILPQVSRCHARNAVNKINRHIFYSLTENPLKRFGRLTRTMPPAQVFKPVVIPGLHSDTDPVDAKGCQGAYIPWLYIIRIYLHCYLRVIAYTEVLPHCSKNPFCLGHAQQRGCSSPQVYSIHRLIVEVARSQSSLACERLNQGIRFTAVCDAVKITVAAKAPAERYVDVDAGHDKYIL